MVRGPVRKQSMDPVRSGGPRTGGQSFRVTPNFRQLRNSKTSHEIISPANPSKVVKNSPLTCKYRIFDQLFRFAHT